MSPASALGVALLLALIGSSCAAESADKIIVANGDPEHEVGALIDGREAGTLLVDSRRIGIGDEIVVGELDRGDEDVIDEAILFTHGRPPVVVPTDWQGDGARPPAKFPEEFIVRLNVWIVFGKNGSRAEPDLQAQKQHAIGALSEAQGIFDKERMGIQFEAKFPDVPNSIEPDSLADFSCEIAYRLKAVINAGVERLDVFYLDTVIGGDSDGEGIGRGLACDEGTPGANPKRVIAMGSSTSGHLLAHEIGHSFGIGHWVSPPCGEESVMHDSSKERKFLTEGEVYAMHFNQCGSSLRTVCYARWDTGARYGDPFLDTEIWPDCLDSDDLVASAEPVSREDRGIGNEEVEPYTPADVSAWLARDCAVFEPGELFSASELRIDWRNLVPVYTKVVQHPDGPELDELVSSEETRQWESAARDRFRIRKAAIDGRRVLGITEAQWARLDRETIDEYIRDTLTDINRGRRSRAIAALALALEADLTEDSRTMVRDVLAGVASDDSSPLAAIARRALLRGPQPER